tara:strand:- start:1156 stop:1374 length:219 start_codon:yes stop_codon:yes gene_type:complete
VVNICHNKQGEFFIMNVKFYLLGGGELNIPARAVSGFYKDDITGNVIVVVEGQEFKVRDSLEEIKYILGIAK